MPRWVPPSCLPGSGCRPVGGSDGSHNPALAQALLAYGTDGFLIGTAMLPHAGIGQNMAHRNIGTGVVSHTLTFHEPVPFGEWLLLAHESPYAGRGASYGTAQVFTQRRPSGGLVRAGEHDP